MGRRYSAAPETQPVLESTRSTKEADMNDLDWAFPAYHSLLSLGLNCASKTLLELEH